MEDLEQIGKLSTTFNLKKKCEERGVELEIKNYLLYLAYWVTWYENEGFGNRDMDNILLAENYFKICNSSHKMCNINFNGDIMIVHENKEGLYEDSVLEDDVLGAFQAVYDYDNENEVTTKQLDAVIRELKL